MSYSPTGTVYGATFNEIRFTRIGSSAPLNRLYQRRKIGVNLVRDPILSEITRWGYLA